MLNNDYSLQELKLIKGILETTINYSPFKDVSQNYIEYILACKL